MLAYYTFSKKLDNASALADNFAASPFIQNPYNIRADKGLASDHAPHRFVTSYIYELPFGRGKPWLSSVPRAADALFGGWQVAGVVTLMSGMPESALEAPNQANVDSGSRRPDRVCDGNLGSARTLKRWFDTSCYVLQPLYQYGNAGRDTIIGPGLVDFDLNLSKEFMIRENKRLQFRSEFFNIMNTPYFRKTDLDVGDADFRTGHQPRPRRHC